MKDMAGKILAQMCRSDYNGKIHKAFLETIDCLACGLTCKADSYFRISCPELFEFFSEEKFESGFRASDGDAPLLKFLFT